MSKASRKYKKRRKKIYKIYKKRDRNLCSLYHGDMNFKNSMDEESARNMEGLEYHL